MNDVNPDKVTLYNSLLTGLVRTRPGTPEFEKARAAVDKAWANLSAAERSEAYEVSAPLRNKLKK
jgi:hypothetical protein